MVENFEMVERERRWRSRRWLSQTIAVYSFDNHSRSSLRRSGWVISWAKADSWIRLLTSRQDSGQCLLNRLYLECLDMVLNLSFWFGCEFEFISVRMKAIYFLIIFGSSSDFIRIAEHHPVNIVIFYLWTLPMKFVEWTPPVVQLASQTQFTVDSSSSEVIDLEMIFFWKF